MHTLEFIAFVAMSLVIGAMATDMMLPTLETIDNDLSPPGSKLSPAVIAAFLFGMGGGQIVVGPVGDRYGRRPLYLGGGIVFILGGLLTALADGIAMLVVARLLQGFGAGALRVAVYSIIRDCCHGSDLVRILSLAMTILLLEPIIAPMLGQLVMQSGSWRTVPIFIASTGAMVLVWACIRLEESRPFYTRRTIAMASTISAYRGVVGDRKALSYMLVYGLVIGAHVGFLTSSQGIFQQTYNVGLYFTPFLALVSLAAATASLLNAYFPRMKVKITLIRYVLYGQLAVNGFALLVGMADLVGLPQFLAIQTLNMFALGLLAPNLSAMAMSQFGHMAGTAAAVFGFVTTFVGAACGLTIGHGFDGTVFPLFTGYAVLSAVALLILQYANTGRPQKLSAIPDLSGKVRPNEISRTQY